MVIKGCVIHFQIYFESHLEQCPLEGHFRHCLLVVDGTECSVEKPVDNCQQALLFSGKKGYTTLMYELDVLITTREIVYYYRPYQDSQNN